MGKGNQVTDNSLMSIILLLKQNILKSTHCADVVKVLSQNNGKYQCSRLNNNETIIDCYALQNLNIVEGSLCLVLYCDTDIQTNTERMKTTGKTNNIAESDFHSLNNGVIVGVIYQNES